LIDRLAAMVRLLMSPVGEAVLEHAEALAEARELLAWHEEEKADAEVP